MRGQISTELLVIVAFILFLYLPIIFFAYFRASEAVSSMDIHKAYITASRLSTLANSVAYSGENSSVVLEVSIPKGAILSFRDYGKSGEVVVTLADGTEIAKPTDFPLSGEKLREGFYRLEISFDGKKVNIQKFSP